MTTQKGRQAGNLPRGTESCRPRSDADIRDLRRYAHRAHVELQQFYRTTKKRQNRHQRPFNICGYLPLTYMGNSGSYMMSADLTTSQLTVKFNEPNPANRVAEIG